MSKQSDSSNNREKLREKIIGLGDLSLKKSYYPQLKKRLQELEKFRAIIDQTDEGIIVIEESSGRFVDVNHSAYSHLKIKPNGIIGTSVYDLDSLLGIKISEFLKNDTISAKLEISISEGLYWGTVIEANLKKTIFNQKSYIIVLTRDITKERQLEKEKEILLEISRLFLNADSTKPIYDNLPGLLSEKLGFPIISIDKYSPESNSLQNIGRFGVSLPKNSTADNEKENICYRVYNSGIPFLSGHAGKLEHIYHPLFKDREIETIICIPLKVEKQILGSLLLASDKKIDDPESIFQTTQVVANHLAQELRRKNMREKLVEKNKDLSQFADRVSHNLKNSLSLIHGYFSLINENPDMSGKFLSKIEMQIDKIYRFIDNVLLLSKAVNKSNEQEPVEFIRLINNIFNSYKSSTPADLKIKTCIDTIFGDYDSLYIIFDNLVSNSFNYRDRDKENLIVEIECKRNKNNLMIYYMDNGMGIPKENLKLIFDIGVSEQPGKRTGFGLNIVKKIVESYGGRIWAESRGKGKGAKFCLILPDVCETNQNIQSK